MNAAVVLLCVCGFALMGALPLRFFRRGRLNVAWLLTATPFFVDAVLLFTALAGVLSPVQLRTPWRDSLSLAAVPLVACALALIGWTAGVHRARVSLWHQPNDAPAELVTCGPYAYVRHPFYAAFILLLLGAAAALPHAGTLAMLLGGVVQLGRTARREERRLLASGFGAEYRAYMQGTGRFFPLRALSVLALR